MRIMFDAARFKADSSSAPDCTASTSRPASAGAKSTPAASVRAGSCTAPGSASTAPAKPHAPRSVSVSRAVSSQMRVPFSCPALHTTARGCPSPHGSLKRGQVKLLQRALVNTAVQRPAVCLLVDHGQPPRAATHTRALHALQERRGQRPRQAGVLGPGVGAASAQRAALQVHVRQVQQLCAAAARLPPSAAPMRRAASGSNDAAAAHADGKQTPPADS